MFDNYGNFQLLSQNENDFRSLEQSVSHSFNQSINGGYECVCCFFYRELSEQTGPAHPFADLLMESLIEKPAVDNFRERQRERDKEQTEEFDDEEEAVEDDDGPDSTPTPEPHALILDDRGRHLLHEEFRHIMQERFLEGRDALHVDYGDIDTDTNLDVNEVAEMDREERYFDEEDVSPPLAKKIRVERLGSMDNEDIAMDLDYWWSFLKSLDRVMGLFSAGLRLGLSFFILNRFHISRFADLFYPKYSKRFSFVFLYFFNFFLYFFEGKR